MIWKSNHLSNITSICYKSQSWDSHCMVLLVFVILCATYIETRKSHMNLIPAPFGRLAREVEG
jgi:hypothetical protein